MKRDRTLFCAYREEIMSSKKGARPQSSYGRDRKGSARSNASAAQKEHLPKRVESIEKRNTKTEYSFNKHAKVKEEMRRGRQMEPEERGVSRSRHFGDENIREEDMSVSMPERMMRLTVGERSGRRGSHSPVSSGSNSPMRRSFEDLSVGDASPVLIRSKTLGAGNHGDRGRSRAEMSNAKLAMMKKKLEPLPSRSRIESCPSSEDLRDHSPGPLTPS